MRDAFPAQTAADAPLLGALPLQLEMGVQSSPGHPSNAAATRQGPRPASLCLGSTSGDQGA